jgi:hypothetical protein
MTPDFLTPVSKRAETLGIGAIALVSGSFDALLMRRFRSSRTPDVLNRRPESAWLERASKQA